MADVTKFRMGRLDHVHIRVPDRAEAVAWYATGSGPAVPREAIAPTTVRRR
jgi:hypothetical protein